MDQVQLLLLVTAVTAFFTVRWALRLAPPLTELPVKSFLALMLAALVALQPFFGYRVSTGFHWLALIAAPVWTFGPLACVALARARRYGLADGLAKLLYWGPAGRAGLGRLLAQAALQQADPDAAERLTPGNDPLLAVQAAALRHDWHGVLELEHAVPRTSDNAFLADDAVIRAHIGLGQFHQAQEVLSELGRRAADNPAQQGPIGYRVLKLGEARLAAEHGDMQHVRRLLSQVPQGTPAWLVYEIVARAAEKAHRPDEAASLYSHTYQVAPPGAREHIGTHLLRLGRPVPKLLRRGPAWGTYVLGGVLLLAYLGQLLLNANVPQIFTMVGAIRPSDAVAAWMTGVPLAGADALWRHVSYAFVHGNLIHIGFNVWVLLDLGKVYEGRRNWGSLLMAFLFGTVMGAYLSGIAQAGQVQLLVGASGGILGVGGALLADALRSGLASDRQLVRSLVQWVAMIILFSLAVPNVSLWGHIGGLVGGLLWGFMRQGLPANVNTDRFAGGVAIGVMLWALLEVARQALGLF